jgi:4-amino-4-deoxy-L-arabinose transferase-like glycosyltransferase
VNSARAFIRSHAFVVLLFAAWMLPGLIGHDPWKPDEAYSFGLVYSALREPGPVPLLAGEPFVEKPPLYYFTAAATARLLSPPLALHDAARLATALYIGIAALFVFLTARALFDLAAGRLAVVLLLGSVGLLVRGHQLITDSALLAGFAVSLYGLARCADRPLAGGFWLGTGAGVGFMAKGLLAPGVIGITAILLPVIARTWRRAPYLFSLAIAAISIVPWMLVWPLALFEVSPALFNEWFWDNNFGRFLGTSQLGPKAAHGHYLKIVPWYTLPVLPLAAWAVWRACRREGVRDEMRLLICCFAVTLAVLSVSADARELYALPLLLPLAILAARGFATLPSGASNGWFRMSVALFSALILAAWFGWFALEFGVPAAAQRALLRMSPDYAPGVRWLACAVAAAYTAGWFFVLRASSRQRDERAAIAWTTGLTVTWALAMTLYIGWIDASKSYRALVIELKSALPPSYDCISSRGLGEPQRAMLDYFGDVTTYRTETAERRQTCELMLVQSAPADAIDSEEVLWRGARAGDANERFILYRVRR